MNTAPLTAIFSWEWQVPAFITVTAITVQSVPLPVQCGGDKQAVAAAEPYLKVMGRNIVYCGQPGNGQAAKVYRTADPLPLGCCAWCAASTAKPYTASMCRFLLVAPDGI